MYPLWSSCHSVYTYSLWSHQEGGPVQVAQVPDCGESVAQSGPHPPPPLKKIIRKIICKNKSSFVKNKPESVGTRGWKLGAPLPPSTGATHCCLETSKKK
ncbi:hypothetical protein KIL84_022611 [Mauremys mutica]|uniref:Uncharacterized protein n=1 Tax=Mauremys mutica TaxID=74926 RepID=A0A9D3WNK6_9SAUR|nr:hypothetical protein KIL84_022611 [Mauremys mutica]